MPRVAVVGGSLGGLTAALLLRDLGCDVTVHERSASPLEARGAGIAVLPETVRYPVERLHAQVASFCSSTGWIRFLTRDGSVEHEQEHRYLFSSWNSVYRTLLAGLPRERYRLGQEAVSFASDATGVDLRFADGGTSRVDLLVCADGITSAARRSLLPEVAPRYAGYVAFRGTVPEAELSTATYDRLHDALTYQVLPAGHLLAYPIPGLSGATEPGQRLMNLVWYRNVPADALGALLTDRDGRRREVSLPPGAARDEVVTELRESAAAQLAPPLAEFVLAVREPFVQAVFDIEVPRMVAGRAGLLGDAAFAVRPHAAAGTAKAAEDAWVLAEELAASGGDVPTALARWEARQVALGRDLLARTRAIGDSSQVHGTFRAGDPALLFGLHRAGG